jgi:hypothetical protein
LECQDKRRERSPGHQEHKRVESAAVFVTSHGLFEKQRRATPLPNLSLQRPHGVYKRKYNLNEKEWRTKI